MVAKNPNPENKSYDCFTVFFVEKTQNIYIETRTHVMMNSCEYVGLVHVLPKVAIHASANMHVAAV